MCRRFFVFLCSLLMLAPLLAGSLSNRRAPGFSLPDLELRQHDLADYRGKLVLLNFMRTDCPHCNGFSKALSQAAQKYGDRLQVLNIVTAPPDNQATVKDYLQRNGLRHVVLFDRSQVVVSYLKLSPQRPSFNIPHYFVIDERGWIRDDYEYNDLNRGFFEPEGLFKLIDKYLPKSAENHGHPAPAEPGS